MTDSEVEGAHSPGDQGGSGSFADAGDLRSSVGEGSRGAGILGSSAENTRDVLFLKVTTTVCIIHIWSISPSLGFSWCGCCARRSSFNTYCSRGLLKQAVIKMLYYLSSFLSRTRSMSLYGHHLLYWIEQQQQGSEIGQLFFLRHCFTAERPATGQLGQLSKTPSWCLHARKIGT